MSMIPSHNGRRSSRTFVGDLIAAQRSFRFSMCTYVSDLIASACTSPDFGSGQRPSNGEIFVHRISGSNGDPAARYAEIGWFEKSVL